MASFRDIKRKARSDVHKHMRVTALYIPPASIDAAQTPIPCTVRVHSKFAALGDMAGTNFGYAERSEILPRLLIWRAEIAQPVRGAIVSVEEGEAYSIDFVEPHDDLSITATVKRLSAEKSLGLPVPE